MEVVVNGQNGEQVGRQAGRHARTSRNLGDHECTRSIMTLTQCLGG